MYFPVFQLENDIERVLAGFRMRFWQDRRGGKEEESFIICERLHLIISTLLACWGGGGTRLILGNLSLLTLGG